MYEDHERLPAEFYAAINGLDDDALLQRRAATQEVLNFVGGRSEAFVEGALAIEEIDRALLWRKSTGTRERPIKPSKVA